jgi:beta-mannanase
MDFKQKFEPKGNRIIHGAGQSLEQFEKYWEVVKENKPLIYMLYLKIDTIKEKLPEKIKEMQKVSQNLIPQIGLNFISKTKGNQCKEILDGKYDSEILFMISYLKILENPVFLRLGYEFNEPKKYDSQEFILTWKYIVDLFRREDAKNIAFVWCCCSAFSRELESIVSYYPGDEYVDWFGDDLFGVRHFTEKNNPKILAEDFLKLAEKHKKPVMIGESSPARTGVDRGEESWNEWFKPYFEWIHSHQIIKAFCYINWDWGKDWKQPEWLNGRIEENKIVSKNYCNQMKNPRYINHMDLKSFSEKTYNGDS